MEHTTTIKFLRISPKKLRFLLGDIRKKKPSMVVIQLGHSINRSALILQKALKSSIDGASKAMKVSEEDLIFKELSVDEASSLKRFRAGSKGNAKPYKRRGSHIRIILTTPVVKNTSKAPVLKKTEVASLDTKKSK